MPELSFGVEGAEPLPYCATPTLALKLRVACADRTPVQAVALDCQVRIEAQRRRYRPAERERLLELFGEPERWAQTLRSLLWTHASVSVPPFQGETVVDLHLPCTFDFNVQATRYFDSLEEGVVPLVLLFSGSVFFSDEGGRLQVERVPWSQEASFSLPVATWRRVVELYYPNTAWLCLRKDVFDRLAAYKARATLPTWEAALESLLESRTEAGRP
ncbi:MAG TPA: DUF6084 family protein [Candidatus Dormibacteraeota bacterium]|jgi:hypothetical protein|nr:DUF6084 family protein [Candidatus Dormibacteraeota bacterium]